MRRTTGFAGAFLFFLVSFAAPLTAAGLAGARVPAYGPMPLRFEANAGQAPKDVRFVARGAGYGLFITADSVVTAVRTPGASGAVREQVGGREKTAIRVRFAGALPPTATKALDPLPGRSHYLMGDDPSRWVRDVQHYGTIRIEEIYSGIDLVYRGADGRLEYDFVLKPGADPGSIRIQFEGATKIDLDGCGDIVLQTATGALIQHAPVAFQNVDGEHRIVTAAFERIGANEFAFDLGSFDRTEPLIIDPVLVYSTYLGGSSWDVIRSIAVDSSGNAIVAGSTQSTDFPIQSPVQGTPGGGNDEGFVAKFNAAGSALLFSTFFGGSSNDSVYDVAVDSTGVYLTGETWSTDFPTASPYQAANAGNGDVFVAKLSSAGSALIYSTYLGGEYSEIGRSVAVDGSGNAAVGGETNSGDFPVVAALQGSHGSGYHDGFVTKLNATGTTAVYSTYLGGLGNDVVHGLAADSAGNVYATGYTNAANFPTQAPIYSHAGSEDAFVAKLNPSGSALAYSTYLGGTAYDAGSSIAIDGAGNAYVTGSTISTDFPTTPTSVQPTPGTFGDAFVTKINAAGSSVVYSTYVGGNGTDYGNGVAVDAAGNASLIATTSSTNLPTVNALQGFTWTGADVFLAKLSAAGSTYDAATYLGGDADEQGNAVALDSAGDAYVGGTTGAGFPLSSPLQASDPGSGASFVAKLRLAGPVLALSPAALPSGWQCTSYSETITASGGTPPYTFTLLSGTLPTGITLSPSGLLSGTASTGGNHRFVVRASDASGVMGDLHYLMYVGYLVAAPTGLTATAAGETSVSVTWNAVANANSYRVYRRQRVTWTLAGTPDVNSFTDSDVAANTSYQYYVEAVSSGGCVSLPSGRDFATTTSFTDPDLAPGILVRAAHITQLRTAANALTYLATGGSCTYTDSITPSSTVIAVSHFHEVRNCISWARASLGLGTPPWGDLPDIGFLVKASRLTEARDFVK